MVSKTVTIQYARCHNEAAIGRTRLPALVSDSLPYFIRLVGFRFIVLRTEALFCLFSFNLLYVTVNICVLKYTMDSDLIKNIQRLLEAYCQNVSL